MEQGSDSKIRLVAVRIDRLAAWVLLVVIIAYAVTGFGLTKGIIDRNVASSLHLGWLGAVGLLAFVIHTAWAIHLAFRRHNFWNRWVQFGLALLYIILISFFIYLQFFYSGSNDRPVNLKSDVQTEVAVNNNSIVFTAATLKTYNGLNGQPAYVAIDGLVYDMSSVFRNGTHHGYSAGQELSEAFYSEHPASYLSGYSIVGTYQAD